MMRRFVERVQNSPQMRCQSQSNRWVLRCRANARGESVAVRRAAGRLFQMCGPATAKLLIPCRDCYGRCAKQCPGVWCRLYKAGERAGGDTRRDRRHHSHRSHTAAHLETARHHSRPTRVRSLREGACQRSLGHGTRLAAINLGVFSPSLSRLARGKGTEYRSP